MADGSERRAEPADGAIPPLFDLVDVPLLIVSAAPLAVIAANAPARRLFGSRLAAALPAGVETFGGSAAPALLAGAFAATGEDGRGAAVVITCQVDSAQVEGGLVHLQFSPAALPGEGGCWLLTVSEAPAPASSDWRASLGEIMDLVPVGIEVYDNDLNGQFFNRRADELFLYEGKAIIHHDEWFEFGFPDPAVRQTRMEEWHDLLEAARRNPDEVYRTEWSMRCRDGEQHVVQFLCRFVRGNFVMVLWDVTEQRALEAELRRLAQSDPLTGIRNRRAFFEAAEAAFAAARGADEALALLILDIDHFKAINDRYGHPAGDVVIRTITERCAAALGTGEVFARIGGEEFAVLLPTTGPEGARATAERLLDAVAGAPITAHGGPIPARISIGATARGAADESFIAMMARADGALYEAKNGGRGRVVAKNL